MTTARYRTIWVSDTHLGTRGCQAQALLEFLDGHACEYLYLVGDIIDFWRLKRAPHWAPLHSDVYGDMLGYEVPRCQAFPFSVLSHPQYVCTVMTIWGFFVVMRFPHDDWILLPALETVYYVVGTWLEPGVSTPAVAVAP